MVKVVKVILSFALVLSVLGVFNTAASAETADATPGFYINNALEMSVQDFAKVSKGEKKAIIKKMIRSGKKGILVMPGKVYSFTDAIFATEEQFAKMGEPIASYIAKNGPLTTGNNGPVVADFKIISIE